MTDNINNIPFDSLNFFNQNKQATKGKIQNMIETMLDYKKILAGQGTRVNLAFTINAPNVESRKRRPVAFGVCLDRSGSMEGKPFENALEACCGVIRNLGREDYFSLTAFDHQTREVISPGKIEDKESAIRKIRALHVGGATNLGGGWCLSRDSLKYAPSDMPRRILLLSDGVANHGIFDMPSLISMAESGLENEGIRTSCLGFGDHYNEDLLTGMSNRSSGNFYDVENADKLPAVFDAELDGALKISVQNLRIRVKREDFCERWKNLPEFKGNRLPDGRIELMIGDLISEELRSFALEAKVLPIPLGADGSQIASLEGEKLLSLEFLYDLVEKERIVSKKEQRLIRIQATQDPSEVSINESVLPIVTSQKTGRIMKKAIALLDHNRFEDAIQNLNRMLGELESLGRPELVHDSLTAIKSIIRNVEKGWHGTRGRKSASYSSRSLRRRSSKEYWSGDEANRPSFKDEQR